MAGTKQMRIGKLQKHVHALNLTAKFLEQLSKECTIPAKRAYYDGKLDAYREIIKGLNDEFLLEGGVMTWQEDEPQE